jgi:CubicO group peptidase (beta-lactamase class C family)
MRIFWLFYLVLIASLGNTQTSSVHRSSPLEMASPESEGMSSERLDRISNMIQSSIADMQIPGAVALVARNGKIVFHEAFGTKSENGDALEKDDIFRIASQSKAITSTAVMQLWEHGHFALDEPISKWIPEFKDPQVLDTLYDDGTYETTPANKEITIRHLLTHTSGIGYGVIDGNPDMKKIYADAGIIDLYTTENISIGDNIKKLAKLPLHHIPGERFTYSEGLDVLGYFIEIISGKPFDQYLRDHIFDPLGMDDTWFYLPQSKHDRLVAVQKTEEKKWVNYPTTFYDPDYPKKGAMAFFSGGAGLSSTAKDYATFLQMYLNKGELNGVRILSRTTVDVIMANQIKDLWGDANFYGLAFGVKGQKGADVGGQGSKGTFDWGGYFNTQYYADPEEQIIGVLMKQTQGNNGDQTSWKFRQIVGASVDD